MRVLLLLAGTLVAASPVFAQNCKKGKPCGHSCIAANKVCRVGTSSDDNARDREDAQARGLVSSGQAVSRAKKGDSDVRVWVGAIADLVYFRDGCSAALDLAVDNRRLFMSREEAEAAGYRRSRVRDC